MKRLLLLLLAVSLSFASSSNSSSSGSSSPSFTIDLSPLLGAITNLPGQIVGNFYNYTNTGLSSAAQTIGNNSFKFMFSSPDPNWFCAPYNGIMTILDGMYALVLMGLALFMILRSGDVEGRMTAKKWMENLIIMIIVLSFSFPLFKILLDFNVFLSSSLANQSMGNLFNFNSLADSTILSFVVLSSGAFLCMITFLTLLLRYLLIPVFLMLFPFAIFLYFIPPSQSWGRTFLLIIIIFVFMTTADALVLAGISAMFNSADPNLADPFIHSIAMLAGFASFGFVNLILIVLALLSIVTQSKVLTGMAGLPLLLAVLGV